MAAKHILSRPSWLRPFLCGIITCMLARTLYARSSMAPRRVRGEKAWILSVSLEFNDAATADRIVTAWRDAADWCYDHEPFLLSYEISKSDQRGPFVYLVYERYRSKADLAAHHASPAYRKFRPLLRALQDAGEVVVTGESGNELGLGFT